MASPEDSRPPIQASLTILKDTPVIRLDFPYDKSIIDEVRAIRGRVWSHTNRCWYVPDTGGNRKRFGLSEFDQRADVGMEGSAEFPYQSICQSLLDGMREKIILRALSPHTLKTYMNHIKIYLSEIGKTVNPMDMTKADIEKYLLKRYEQHPTSESERNCHINSIKFLYEHVLGRERMLFYLTRPEKPQHLSKVLGEYELERMFRSVTNLKHKTILLTAFSCGLRVGEVTSLRVRDIDNERMQVYPVR